MSVRSGFGQVPYRLPTGATEVILVRHGSSADAEPDMTVPLLEGRSDPRLSTAGVAQADAVAERLSAEPITGLFVTTLQRTVQTAEPLAHATGLSPVPIPDLVEVSLGEWDGGEFLVRMRDRDPTALRVYREHRWDAVPGGEPFSSLGPRVRAGVDRIVTETGPEASAVAVVHGGVIGELCRQATGSDAFAFVHAENGSISRLVVDRNGRWLLRSFNDVAHLTAPAEAGWSPPLPF